MVRCSCMDSRVFTERRSPCPAPSSFARTVSFWRRGTRCSGRLREETVEESQSHPPESNRRLLITKPLEPEEWRAVDAALLLVSQAPAHRWPFNHVRLRSTEEPVEPAPVPAPVVEHRRRSGALSRVDPQDHAGLRFGRWIAALQVVTRRHGLGGNLLARIARAWPWQSVFIPPRPYYLVQRPSARAGA